VRVWPHEARVLLFGVPLTWLCLHLVFLGGTRFHVPETLAYALFAACGIDVLARTAGRWRLSPGRRRGRAT